MLPKLSLQPTVTESQLERAWRLGHTTYQSIGKPEWYPDFDVVKEWWDQYPDAVFRLVDETGGLWGYISFWPLTPHAAERMQSGDLKEEDLNHRHVGKKGQGPFRDWYIADICRRPRPQGSSAAFSRYMVQSMMGGGMVKLTELADVPESLVLMAIAATGPGENLLRGAGFSPVASRSPSRVFAKAVQRPELRAFGEEILKKNAPH